MECVAEDFPPAPLTRAEQQSRTRAALVASARRVFGRDGFNGANLATIAREAGLTKGAVYSNFDGKADLFLAVLDDDMASFEPASWDPAAKFASVPNLKGQSVRLPGLAAEERDALGFGLATLEFAAAAARDQELSDAFSERLGRLLAGFEAIARRGHCDDDPLSAEQLGTMLMAFDQGAAIHWLAGQMEIDAAMVREVMLRMLRPTKEEIADED
ncbi:MAG TPA: TetR/AcrR family transcriptional regulator [Acidimicrobiia bacterium]|nr:TetR/AcrR family transcriptional regulator [Acidimicrobiia bacterium]